jgi:ketosteroid isomerase-like protein
MGRIVLIAACLVSCLVSGVLASEKEVRGFLDRQVKAFETRDINALMEMLSPNASVVMLGNGPADRWVGPEDIKRAYQHQMAQYVSEKFTLRGTTIGARDSIGWFSTQARILKMAANKAQSTLLINWSGVLQKSEGKWLLIQSHFSLPISKP